MTKLTLLTLLLALLVGTVLSDSCISRPGALRRGEGCGGNIGCGWNTYCSEEGVCVASAKEDEDCEKADCAEGLDCVGNNGYYRCKARVHPGQECSQYYQSIGQCGTDNCNGYRCEGGSVGDACYLDTDCLGKLKCTNRVCTGVALGGECDSGTDCVVGAYCDEKGACRALPTSGNCTYQAECAYGYACEYPSGDADFTFPRCVALGSVAAGSYCNYNTPSTCASKRCFDNRCAAGSPSTCNSASQCAADEFCGCEGDQLMYGIGSCKANLCAKLEQTYFDCFGANCRSGAYFNGSCVQRNCDKAYLKYQTCSPASTLLASFFPIALLALLASFLSRHF